MTERGLDAAVKTAVDHAVAAERARCLDYLRARADYLLENNSTTKRTEVMQIAAELFGKTV